MAVALVDDIAARIARGRAGSCHRVPSPQGIDCIVAEKNNGGEMVEQVIRQIDRTVPVRFVGQPGQADQGAADCGCLRATPRASCRELPALEDEMCLWVPGDPSPNRLDAMVWCGTYLMVDATGPITSGANPFYS